MSDPINCDICGRVIPMSAYYIVKIKVFADPSLPALSAQELQAKDVAGEMKDLLAELQQYSTEELEDMVQKRFEFRLCRPCQLRFIANPLGLPRARGPGRN